MNQIHYLSGKLSGSLNEHGRNGQQVTLAFNLLTLQEVFLKSNFLFHNSGYWTKIERGQTNCLYTETPKWVLWQTVKTQMHFIRACTVC